MLIQIFSHLMEIVFGESMWIFRNKRKDGKRFREKHVDLRCLLMCWKASQGKACRFTAAADMLESFPGKSM